mgnify:CR=1 FL=1
MVKTVLPVLKADFPSASRLSFFGFRTSLKAHSRRTCMGPEKIGSDCSCVVLCITPVLVSYFHRNYDDQPMDIGVHVRRWDALDQWVFSGDGILD